MPDEDQTFDITIPQLGESVTEATLSSWLKNEGDAVEEDEAVAELETDKVSVEITAPAAGILSSLLAKPGDQLTPGELIAKVSAAKSEKPAAKTTPPPAAKKASPPPLEETAEITPAAPPPQETQKAKAPSQSQPPPGPAARKLAAEKEVDISKVKGTGKHGQVTRDDIADFIEAGEHELSSAPEREKEPQEERIVPLSPIRKVIAQRMLQSQQNAAILTTFNEADMKALVDLRKRHKDAFFEKHGVKLGYVSFFARAAVCALEEFPELGAEIRGENIVYKRDTNIAVAVSGPKGLAVPVIRKAQELSIAGLEKEIARLAVRVREGKIKLDELQGGTFTISNGGVYGSMMSTPILNPPQSGILGMHKITERPVAIAGEVVIRPMMYLALSYDHRIVDGKEAVQFLVKIKEIVESPERLLLDL